MVELAARSPGHAAPEQHFGRLSLGEYLPDRITAVMPFPGRHDAVSKDIGVPFPAPGRITQSNGTMAIWAGQNLALVLNGTPHSANGAITDHSDAWGVFDLKGPGIDPVMARLCPIDTRAAHFPPGHTARTLIGQLNASVTRLADDHLRLMVYRSMVQTALHEIIRAISHAQR